MTDTYRNEINHFVFAARQPCIYSCLLLSKPNERSRQVVVVPRILLLLHDLLGHPEPERQPLPGARERGPEEGAARETPRKARGPSESETGAARVPRTPVIVTAASPKPGYSPKNLEKNRFGRGLRSVNRRYYTILKRFRSS